jgi:hypothetical protein
MDVRIVDVALLTALTAASWLLLDAAIHVEHINYFSSSFVAGAALAVITLLVAWLSLWRAVWLRKLHLGHNDTPGTSLRHRRLVGTRLPCPYPDAWYAVALTGACSW